LRPEADEVWIDHAPSFATQIILRRHLPNRKQSRLLVLGDSPQAQADGRQIMGRRLPVSSRGAPGRKAGTGRFSQWTVHGGRFEIFFLTADQRRDSRWQTALHATLLDMPERPLRGAICPRELTALQIPRFIADRAAENRK